MPKTKLTLYVDKETVDLAKKISAYKGKSISEMVSSYLNSEASKINNLKVSDAVSKWIGVVKTDKTYKELKEEIITEKIEKYENIS
ncbi:MAG: DUF6364 family protein [Actinobacteria bacterium]|nr:DUF6364 family protein [Cyanobacteriota bacterium]MCL5771825.1 DUF6364 family protein [Actinomycetota bacterium]